MKNKEVEMILGRARGLERAGQDTDGDGLPDGIDCAPYDKDKQGIVHDLFNKYKERQQEAKQRKAATSIIRKRATAEYYREKEKQELRVAREKAKIEADRKIKYKKEGGFVGQVTRLAQKAATPSKTQVVKTYKKSKKKSSKKKKTMTTSRQPPKKPGTRSYNFTEGGIFV